MRRRMALVLALVLAFLSFSSPLYAHYPQGRAAQSAGPTDETFYVVQRGDTLFSIAQRYGSTVDAFAHFNGLADPSRIYVGQRLKIPPSSIFGIDPAATVPYVVQLTDTLTDVARRHGTTWRALAWLNGLVSPSGLHAGQTLRVPPAEADGGLAGALHGVAAEETLYHIALRHDVPPWRLLAANGLSNPALLFSGQEIVIPGVGEGRLPAPFVSVGVHPLPVSQGETVVIEVRTTHPVTLTGELFEGELRFVQEGDVHYGLAAVHVFTEPGVYELTIRAAGSGGRVEVSGGVAVEGGRFGHERIYAPPGLLDPGVGAAERELLNALRPTFTEERQWSGPFLRPTGGSISSDFGTRRAYNDGPYTSYHAGVDMRGATGTPVVAPAAGTVVLTEDLTVRGGALMLDHGWGVLTGYWHLSATEVEVGQRVEQGDLIARIGNTGLSTGAHLHWEMWVGGVPVNPMQWLTPFYAWPD